MYNDLFDALGGGGGNPNASRGNNAGNTNAADSEASNNNKPLLSFKAGKMEMALQEDGNFMITPDTRRCLVNLKYNDTDSQLEWEWFDRREKKVMDTIRITDPVLLKRADVPKSQDADQTDRVYYWKMESGEWQMLWLQDKEEDPELVDKANEILKVTRKPGTPGDASPSGSPGNASTSSASTTTRQVDALSNILENLGMPQGGAAAPGEGGAAASSPAPAAGGGGTLTLADLQSAMGGMAQQQASTHPPALSEIVTSDAITSLLANADVRQRLLEQLPEEQRTEAFLEENLRSPQIQQTLRSLTAALMPDDNGSMDGYHSVLANFQLDAADGQGALTSGQSPVQAFLDCVLASVEKEKAMEAKEETGDEAANEDDEMKE